MSYKCAVVGLPFGGGKATLIEPRNRPRFKTKKYWAAYARFVNELEGEFFTGEDVGITHKDAKTMRSYSKYIIGAGDGHSPSPFAAEGVYYAIRGALRFVFGSSKLFGKHVVVKGVGNLGSHLVKLLLKDGALVTISDINPSKVSALKRKFPKVNIVDNDKAHTIVADVFAPCALGNDIRSATENTIMARIVCGGANNQVADAHSAIVLSRRGITYVPDFVSNAGGLIVVADELNARGFSLRRVSERIKNIERKVFIILTKAKRMHTHPSAVARLIATEKLGIA
jgi:leucine dehydrogenase